MPDTVTINGINFPVVEGGWSRSFDVVGDSNDRSATGRATSASRTVWRDSGRSVLVSETDARMLAAIANRQGHMWPGGVAYSTTGVANAAGSSFTVSSSGGRWGPRLSPTSGALFRVDLGGKMGLDPWRPDVHGWMIACWKLLSAADGVTAGWYHYVIAGSSVVVRGAAANPSGVLQWRGGVSGNYGSGNWIDVAASGIVAVSGHNTIGTAGIADYSDLWVMPSSMARNDWAAGIAANAALAALPAYPRVRMGGLAYPLAEVAVGKASARPLRAANLPSTNVYSQVNATIDIEMRQA